MFRNNLKNVIRSLSKNKAFTFLNVFGLTIGLTVFFLILLYIKDEISFDRFNTKASRIFRVNTDTRYDAVVAFRAIAAPVAAGVLLKTYPEVEDAVRLLSSTERFKKGNEIVLENNVVYSDASIFNVFTLPMISGNPATALTTPYSVVITESTAKKYFNTKQIVGKTLTMVGENNSNTPYTITGIIRDIPRQSHFNFDFFLSMSTVAISHNSNFAAFFPFSTYLLLKPGADYTKLEAKFPALLRQHITFLTEMEFGGNYIKINLTPLTAIHLHSNRTDELGTNGSIENVRIFGAIAILILITACTNFMNLSTARSFSRAREVGIRKVLGSTRKSLMAQFLLESFMVAAAAAAIATAMAWLLLPLFNQLSGKQLAINAQSIIWLLPSVILTVAVVGTLAGTYPAFFLSAFQPIRVLKGRLSTGVKISRLRSPLVIFQFSIAICMIIGTLVIYYQLQYIQNKNLGFSRNRVLVIKNMNALDSRAALLKQEIKQLTGVVNATLSSFFPTGNRRWINYVRGETTVLQTQFWPIDEDYLPVMDMQLAKGRNFSTLLATDSAGIIVNETAAKMLGYAGDPLNKNVYYGKDEKTYHILGVVKDFNFSSLRDNVSPVVVMMMTAFEKKLEGSGSDALCVKLNTANIPALLASIESKWKIVSNQQHFDYSFMDEAFDAEYRDEQRTGKIFALFSGLAILIACLGLFGLAAYAAEQRSKEISIRKVLGANVSTIVALLSKDFLKLVIISILIAAPISWLAMTEWLQGFAYRVSIPWWTMAVAACTALFMAFITISFQSIKAANINPIQNLCAE